MRIALLLSICILVFSCSKDNSNSSNSNSKNCSFSDSLFLGNTYRLYYLHSERNGVDYTNILNADTCELPYLKFNAGGKAILFYPQYCITHGTVRNDSSIMWKTSTSNGKNYFGSIEVIAYDCNSVTFATEIDSTYGGGTSLIVETTQQKWIKQ